MAVYQFTNSPQTNLNGAINNVQGTIVVTSNAGFPTSGQFPILIDNEIMLVTGGSNTTTWNVTRAAEPMNGVQAASSHNNNAVVSQVVTAASLTNTFEQRGTQSLAYAATVTPDASLGTLVTIGTLTGNITIGAPTNPVSGQRLTLIFTQDATGGRTVTWNAVFKTVWQPASAPNAISSIGFEYDGTNWQQNAIPFIDNNGYSPSVYIRGGNPWCDVKAFGAKGDGVTDDTSAINAAVAATPAGGIVFFPTGTYIVSALSTISKSLVLLGSGKDATTVQVKTGTATATFPISAATGLTIEKMTLDGTGQTGAAVALVNVTGGSTTIRVDQCRLQNCQVQAITLNNVQRAWITNNEFLNLQYSAVRLENPGVSNHNDYIWITDNYINGVQLGNVAGNAAIQSHGTNAVSHRYVHVEGNYIVGSKIVGIGLDSLDFSWVERNHVDNTGASGEPIAFTGTRNRVLHNRVISGSGASGILLWAVTARTNDHNEIAHNEVTGSTGQGIGIAFGVQSAVINDLYVHDNEVWGCPVGIQSYAGGGVTAGTWTDVVVMFNKLIGNTTSTTWVGFAGNPANDTGNVLTSGGWIPFNTKGALMTHTTSAHGVNSQTLAANGAVTFDASLGDIHRVTLQANATSSSIANPTTGQKLTIEWLQDGTGSRTYVWPTTSRFAGGVAPTASTTANWLDSVTFRYDGALWIEQSRAVAIR